MGLGCPGLAPKWGVAGQGRIDGGLWLFLEALPGVTSVGRLTIDVSRTPTALVQRRRMD